MITPQINSQTVCPFCELGRLIQQEKSCRDYLSGEDFFLLTCSNCHSSFTFLNQTAQNKNYYGNKYYNSKRGKFLPFFEKIFRFNHRVNAKFLKRNFSSKTILEVGCGRGYLLRELKKTGSDVYCLESPSAADWILNNKDIKVISSSDNLDNSWPFKSEYFDLVIFWHVLEHLCNPIESIDQATRCLKSGGIICVSVPNIASLQAKLNLPTWFHLDVPRHLHHFSKQGIISLFESRGYLITMVKAGDRMQNFFGWLQSIANLFTPKNTNSLFRFLQGGKPLKSARKLSLLIQILTVWLWFPLGVLGFILEEIFHNYGSITIYAKKV